MKTLMKFWAPWCQPCTVMTPRVKEALVGVSDVNFEAINVDENGEAASARGVRSIPTLVLLDESGKEVSRLVGAQSVDAIKNLLR